MKIKINRVEAEIPNGTKIDLNQFENEKDHYATIMRFPFILMKIFGQFHRKKDNIYMKIYCVFVLILNWFSFIRICFIFEDNLTFTGNFAYKIINFLIFFLLSVMSTIFFINRHFNSNEEKLISDFNQVYEYHVNIDYQIAYLRKRINFIFILPFLVFILVAIYQIIALFVSGEVNDSAKFHLGPFAKKDWAKNSIPLKLLVSLSLFSTNLAPAFGTSLFISECFLTYNLLNTFNKNFKEFTQKEITAADQSTYLHENENVQNSCIKCENKLYNEALLEYFRVWHFKLSVFVRSLNANLNIIIAFVFLICIGIVLLTIYLMSDWNNNCLVGGLQIYIPFLAIFCFSIIILHVALPAGIAKRVKFKN